MSERAVTIGPTTRLPLGLLITVLALLVPAIVALSMDRAGIGSDLMANQKELKRLDERVKALETKQEYMVGALIRIEEKLGTRAGGQP